MVRLIGYGLMVAVLVAAAVWLADNPGEVQIDWLHWRLTTSVTALLAAMLAALLALWLLRRLWLALLRWPAAWLAGRRDKRREQGYQALTDGLAAVAGGQTRQARKLADKAEKLLKSPRLTGLLSAQSAALAGDQDRQRAHFQALRQHPATALAGLRGLIELARAAGDDAETILLAQEARGLAPQDGALAGQLFDLLVASDQLNEAQDLVIAAGRSKAFDKTQVARRRALLLNEKARQAEAAGDEAAATDFARLAASHDPGFADAALRLARLQAGQGLRRQAAGALEKTWRARPLPVLAAAYGALHPNEAPLQRLRRLEKLAAMHPDAWVTQRVMGEASLDARLWGQARKLLTAAARRPTAALLGLLARLEIGEYKNQGAAQAWLATTPAPEPDWQCRDCGHRVAEWRLACPSCGGIDRLDWPDDHQPPPKARNSAT
jgi:HemY protein